SHAAVVIAARTSDRSRRGRHSAESQRNEFRAPRKTERGLSQAAALTHTRASWKGPWRPLAADTLRNGTLRARAPERVLGRSGESPLLCGEESCGIER